MSPLKIPKTIYQELILEAKRDAPLEACGLLAGSNRTVCKFYPMTNVDASAEHFSMEPTEQFAAVKDMRGQKWEIIGIWHSHPQTPARMSEEDKKMAFMPAVSYVILSLAPDHCGDMKSFRKETNGSFTEERLEIV